MLHLFGPDLDLCSVLASAEDPLFLTWMLRRGRVVLNRVLVQDMVEMWSRMTVVRTIPFLGGFLGLLHYLVLLVLRAAVWDSHTAHRASMVLCCSVGCYCIYFYPSMRPDMRRRSVVLLSLMYHVQPFVSCVINAQVLCSHHARCAACESVVTLAVARGRMWAASLAMFDRGQRDMPASSCTPAGRAIISGRAPGRLHLHLHAILLQQVHRPAGGLELRVLLQVTTPSSHALTPAHCS